MKVAFITLGCKVNTYESNAIGKLFEQRGHEVVLETEEYDACILNTCCVTNQANAKSRKMIRRAHAKRPSAIIAVMGCFSQMFMEECKELGDIPIIIGNVNKSNIVDHVEAYLADRTPIIHVEEDLSDREFEAMRSTTFDQTRAFLKIQDGCNNFCSYCIIPYSRGDLRSKDANQVIEDIRQLVENGYREIVLTGIHTGKYQDKDTSFTKLIHRILAETEIERLRISSIEMNEITDELIALLQNERMAKHLHLPLQAGSNHILRMMNRKYLCEDFERVVNKVKQIIPMISITTDIIVGFPGETEEHFLETLEFASKIKFSDIHIFPYSIRKNTQAATWTQVPDIVKKERVHRLNTLRETLKKEYEASCFSMIHRVLMEEEKDGILSGHASNYLKIKLKGPKILVGEFVAVKLKSQIDGEIFANLA